MKKADKVKQYQLIKIIHEKQGISVRALARKFKMHRSSIRYAIHNGVPRIRKQYETKKQSQFTAHEEWLTALLIADEKVHHKQRHTTHRIWRRLKDERGCTLAESTVRGHIAALKKRLNKATPEVFVPQEAVPGEVAEVDFYEARVVINGETKVLQHLCLRANFSGKAFHIAFLHQKQEAFLEGIQKGLEYLGGGFQEIRFDNLKAAVTRVLGLREREMSDQFELFSVYYDFKPVFCQPGIKGAHEKGGVEQCIGHFRRNALTPYPEAKTLDDYNLFLIQQSQEMDKRTQHNKTQSIESLWEEEKLTLRSLPTEPFGIAKIKTYTVNSNASVSVEQHQYSVPYRFIGQKIEVHLLPSKVEVFDQGVCVARHPRSLVKGEQTLELEHYLEVLEYKPAAFKNAKALAQYKRKGLWKPYHESLLQRLKRSKGEREGTKAMVKMLLQYQSFERDAWDVVLEYSLEQELIELAVLKQAYYRLLESQQPSPLELEPKLTLRIPSSSLEGYSQLLAVEVA
jgi:transposase